MKRIHLLFTFFFIFTINVSAQQYYYWYQQRKILLKVDSSVIYTEITNADSLNSFLREGGGIESFKGNIQQESPISLILMLKSKKKKALLHHLSSAFSFSSPMLKHNQEKIMFAPQIIVELNKGYKINVFLSQYGNLLSLKDMIDSNEYLLNVNTSTFEKVLAIANKISENNDNIEWCEPNFYNSFEVAFDPLYNDQYYLNNTGKHTSNCFFSDGRVA